MFHEPKWFTNQKGSQSKMVHKPKSDGTQIWRPQTVGILDPEQKDQPNNYNRLRLED